MKEYIRERQKQQQVSTGVGIGLTVAAHILACVFFAFNGIKYIYPPPVEESFVIDFQEEEQIKPRPARRGWQPTAEEVDRTKPIELIQKSESPYKSTSKTNATPATKPDDFGDVEAPAIEKEEALDPRAAFPGMSKKDTTTTAPHSATEASDKFKEGQPQGNTASGRVDGKPNAHLKGRNTIGNLPRPGYNVQNEGVVVVDIWVDNYGAVKKAVPGGDGTTVTDKSLWNEARKAAMNTKFDTNTSAPALQQGTITYVFRLQ